MTMKTRTPFKDLGITSTPWKKTPVSDEAKEVVRPEWEKTQDWFEEMDEELAKLGNARLSSTNGDLRPRFIKEECD